MKLVCIGAGYVGGPTSAVIATKCPTLQVVVVDRDASRIEAYNAGKAPIYEPGLNELLQAPNLSFSTDCAQHIEDADLIMVSVNTPTKKEGVGAGFASDLTMWEGAGRLIAAHARGHKIVIEKSTVPVRTAAALRAVIEANKHHDSSFEILSNPEFLAEGTAIKDLTEPDRILIGAEPTPEGAAALEILKSIYLQWIPEDKIITTDLWSSELAKLTANSFLAQRISSINSIAMVCEKTGADVKQVAHAVGLDCRIGSKFLNASVGFGGSCFRKDILNLVYLCRSLGLFEVAEYWLAVVEINELMKHRFSCKIIQSLFTSAINKKIAIFGFAFKKDTADTRETAAATVCAKLLLEGGELQVYDPMVTRERAIDEMKEQGLFETSWDSRFTFCSTAYEAADQAHAIAVLTEWDVLRTLDYQRIYDSMSRPAFIFDGRRILDDQDLSKIGFSVHSLGRSGAFCRHNSRIDSSYGEKLSPLSSAVTRASDVSRM